MMALFTWGGTSLVRLGEIVMILELHRQGASVSAIAREVGIDRKTVRRCIERGLEPPAYGPRPPRASKLAPFTRYLRERLAAVPQLSGRRLHRELRELGYAGGYSILTGFVRSIRPVEAAPFEVRFETPPGRQAQVDFAHFRTVFTDEPGTERIVWLFSMVLGHSRMLWGRFVLHQDLPTLLRSQAAAFEALGGVPAESDSACKKDPLGGVIGVQTGPLLERGSRWLSERIGSLQGDAGGGDDRESSAGVFC
jgi:transposase